MEETKNALNEINKGCSMGIEAINNLIDKIDSKSFKKNLLKELKQYQKISEKIQIIYSEFCDEKPQEISGFTESMTKYMMNIKTIKDDSDSKIAEILLQGINMGIIEGRKIINNKKLKKDAIVIINNFVNIQEKSLESIKKYL